MSTLQEKLTRYRNSEFIFGISTTQLYKNDIFHRCNRNFVKHFIPVLLETLGRIKVIYQAYHGNVFIGNHCKIILNNYKKLCSVASDETELHEHISASFWIYSELDKLISAKRFLTEVEILSVKELCTGFAQFKFSKWNCHKLHGVIFDVLHFLAKHKTLGYLSEEEGESLHCSINKQLQQYQSMRSEGAKLVHVVKNQELSQNSRQKSSKSNS